MDDQAQQGIDGLGSRLVDVGSDVELDNNKGMDGLGFSIRSDGDGGGGVSGTNNSRWCRSDRLVFCSLTPLRVKKKGDETCVFLGGVQTSIRSPCGAKQALRVTRPSLDADATHVKSSHGTSKSAGNF